MNFLDAFQNKTILIPMLQREYVQGGKEDVINPFLDSLIFTEEQCDLNYIYGYDKTVNNETCFIPVDGQQRLTTLWLLYTYMYAKKRISKEFHVTLKFVAREYAQDFCHALQEHLQKLLEQGVKEEDENPPPPPEADEYADDIELYSSESKIKQYRKSMGTTE